MIVSVAEEMNPTRRNTMEDVHVVHYPGSWDAPDCTATFLSVMDGHGGRLMADYLEDNLSKNVADEWRYSADEMERWRRKGAMNDDGVRHDLSKKKRRHDETTTSTEPSKSEIEIQGDIVRTAFERAFLLTDIRSRVDGILTSGATVACCVIIPNYSSHSAKKKNGRPTSISVHAANAGDARAVLSSTTAMHRPRRLSSPRSSTATVSTDLDSNDRTMTTITTLQKQQSTVSSVRTNGAVRITHDHKSTDPDEVARIEKSGGIVMRGRVLGVLAVARSLGDHGLKEYVIGRPYVSSTVVHINDGDDCPDGDNDDDDDDYQIGQEGPYTDGEFIIVACDGLWDVMKDQEAVDLVRGYVRGSDDNDNNSNNGGEKLCFNNSRMKGVSSFLVEEALRRGSADNITVILCWL
jgi:serine/threonine protein phosphatase PrpC